MGRRVLVVDDSATMRDMVSFTMSSAGFEVLEASDGVDALAVADDGAVDLVITDLNMPKMDGLKLIKAMRSRPDHVLTPIIFLTTERAKKKRQAARAAGATAWIEKPFDPERLVYVARKVCP